MCHDRDSVNASYSTASMHIAAQWAVLARMDHGSDHSLASKQMNRMKAEQKRRSDESRDNFTAAPQDKAGIRLLVPPSTPVIVAVETEDGGLVATEF